MQCITIPRHCTPLSMQKLENNGTISPGKSVRTPALARCWDDLCRMIDRLHSPAHVSLRDPDNEINAAMEGEHDIEAIVSQISGDTIVRIKHAQYRAKLGLYGVCENCERDIPIERMEVLPYAVNCVKCESNMARNTKQMETRKANGNFGEDAEEDYDSLTLKEAEQRLS